MLQLLRVMFPYALLVCLAAFFMGMLNARGHFFVPAMGATMLNLVMIASVWWLAPKMGGKLEQQIFGLAIGVVVAGVVLIAMMSDRYEPPPTRVVAPHAEPLELLSLNASREGSTLAVTGIVRSQDEKPLTSITAVVSAIDAKGRPVGRGTVPLDAIRPRSDSRFVVRIQDVNEAARYRVSFRSTTGVIRHVDRRVGRTGDVS
jgi:hypothetical protein